MSSAKGLVIMSMPFAEELAAQDLGVLGVAGDEQDPEVGAMLAGDLGELSCRRCPEGRRRR